MEELDYDIECTGQDMTARRFTACHEHDRKFRFEIRSNSYKFQSHARAYVWNAERGWLLIYEIGSGSMKTPDSLYVRQGLKHAKPLKPEFEADMQRLETMALKIAGCI